MMRNVMPPVYFFLIDVSTDAVQTGATAAACSAIMQVISDLPEGPRTMIGIATYDSTIQFYNLKLTLQELLMLLVDDTEDVYAPFEKDVITTLSECHQNLEQLLENIPTMFQNSNVADSAFGAAIKAAFLAMKSTGGKLLVFQCISFAIRVGFKHQLDALFGIGNCTGRQNEELLSIFSVEKTQMKFLQAQPLKFKSN